MNDNTKNKIHGISLDNLHAHPDNPNRMSEVTFAKLVRNIKRTGRYEPIVVRKKGDSWQIINGHHRVKALKQLGYKTADCLVWDVDDHEAGILLTTLNRLGGTDTLEKKLTLLRRLNKRMHPKELAKLLPQTAKQIERLTNLKLPSAPAKFNPGSLLNPVTFFVDNDQHKIIRQALSLAEEHKNKHTQAKRNAAALTRIAEHYLSNDGRETRDEKTANENQIRPA